MIGNYNAFGVLKIFFYIALNQPNEGIYGFRSTKIQLIVDLEEWVRRQRLDIEREQRLRKQKRLRQFRDAKKQQKKAPN